MGWLVSNRNWKTRGFPWPLPGALHVAIKSFVAVDRRCGSRVRPVRRGFASAAPEKGELGGLATNEGILVDPKTFNITKGIAKTDPTAHIVKLGAREVTNGAVIFRVGDKLYLADADLGQKSLMNAFWDAYDRQRF